MLSNLQIEIGWSCKNGRESLGKKASERGEGLQGRRWTDSLHQNIKIVGEINWKYATMKRESWQKLPQKAKDHSACSANDDNDNGGEGQEVRGT
jgi:hypothetical protein